MRALVTGAEGQLGSALRELLGPDVAWAGGRADLDITDRAAVGELVGRIRPDTIFNAAAYNKVDVAETDPAGALAVNAVGPAHLARAAAAVSALLVHVSTDYVFDGSAARPYGEDDRPHPLGVYGASKLAGETLVDAAGGAFLLVRTSGVFAAGASRAKGGSFVERILARARAGEPLRVVSDQELSPTYAPHLAAGIVELVAAGARGLVHLTGTGACSWHGFAEAALAVAGVSASVEPISTSTLGALARRPRFSVLANDRARALGVRALPHWRDGLAAMLAEAPGT